MKVIEIMRPAHLDDMEPPDVKKALADARTEGVLAGRSCVQLTIYH